MRWRALCFGIGLVIAGAPAQGAAPPAGCAIDHKHGTTVEWETSPEAAAERARREHKLVFVLHLAGEFAQEEFT